MTKITPFPKTANPPSVEGIPAAEMIISGAPAFKTWVHFEDGGMRSGEWEVMPGSWKVSYDRWEYMHVLSGAGSLLLITGHQPTGWRPALRWPDPVHHPSNRCERSWL